MNWNASETLHNTTTGTKCKRLPVGLYLLYVSHMMKQLIMLVLFVVSMLAQPLTPEGFINLDREVAGLMDSWVYLLEGRGDESAGLFIAGTAILRAKAAYETAVHCNVAALPPEVDEAWTRYLKSSADCIISFREAVGSADTAIMEEVLLASFTRWETTGEEFLESVQSTR